MPETNLMDRYPRSKRSIDVRANVTQEDRRISCQFGKEYFDGDRRHGYGGYSYHPRFWEETVKRFRDYYRLEDDASVLDVGCAKGFMLYDFKQLMPNLTVAGIDLSEYAISNAIDAVKPFLRVGNARELPYPDKSFDLVCAINTLHNLPIDECQQALREIVRVSRAHAFVMVDAYRTEEERARLVKWVLTCKTHMYTTEWEALFADVGYEGDYWWFIPD